MTWRTVIPMRYSGLGSNRIYTIADACFNKTGSRLLSLVAFVGSIFHKMFGGATNFIRAGSSLRAQRQLFQAPRSSLVVEGRSQNAGGMSFTNGGTYSRRALFLSLFSTLFVVGLSGISSGGERYSTILASSLSRIVVISPSLIYS